MIIQALKRECLNLGILIKSFFGAFFVVGICLSCVAPCVNASDEVQESRNLVLGVNFSSGNAQEVKDVEEVSVSKAYNVLEKGFKNFAFSIKSDSNIAGDTIAKEGISAKSNQVGENIDNSYELDGLQVVTSYSPSKVKVLGKRGGASKDESNDVDDTAKSNVQNIKQLITFKNPTDTNKTITFRTKSYIASSQIKWDGQDYELDSKPKSFRAYEKTTSITEYAKEIGTDNVKDIENFKNYTHTRMTASFVQFASNDGIGVFDWSDVGNWNHEVLAYKDANQNVLELVLYDLEVPANGELVIDPVYAFDDSGTYDAAFLGDAQLQEVGNKSMSIGDVNGDGISDLLIGVPKADHNGTDSGSVFVIFGSVNSATKNQALSVSANYNIRYDGAVAGDNLTIDGAIKIGDVNSDGLGDLVFGSYIADNNSADSGSAWIIFSTLIDDVGTTTGNNKALSVVSNYNIRYDGGLSADYLTDDGAIQIGDVNGDGLDDLVLGADGCTYSTDNSGGAYVIFSTLIDDVGTSTGNSKPLSTASNYNIRYNGVAANDNLTRYAEIRIGDINGDGLSDLVLGSDNADFNGMSSGSVFVMFSTLIDDVGTTTGNNKPLSVTSSYNIRFDGSAAYDNLGEYGAMQIGDLNGDGLGDLALGSRLASSNGSGSGSAYIIFSTLIDDTGSTTGNSRPFSTAGNYNIRYDGDTANNWLTMHGALRIGDVNGDGLGDLALGTYLADNNGPDSGSAWVIFSTLIDDVGTSTANIMPLSTASNYNIRYDGGAAYDYLTAYGAIQIGDINGDSSNDLTLNAYNAGNATSYSGSSYIIFSTLIDDVGTSTGNNKILSTTTNYNIRYDGSAAYDFLTRDGALNIGDLNGDGLNDLVLGADYADNNGGSSGSAYAIFSTLIDDTGLTTGNNKLLSTTTNYSVRYDGSNNIQNLSKDNAVAIGDVNGDGIDDLVVGSMYASYNGASSGSAFVVFGKSGGLSESGKFSIGTNYNIRYDGAAFDDCLTANGAIRIGDVNGDGQSDLILGAYYADNNGSNAGSAYVIFSTLIDNVGLTTGNNKPLSTSSNYNIRYDGGASDDNLTDDGAIRIGDVNGDGLSDLVLGTLAADNNGSASGSAWIMFSTLIDDVGTSTGNNKPLSTASNYNIRYAGASMNYRLTIDGAMQIGDVNGDGLSDLVLGSYVASHFATDAGSAFVIFSTLIDDVGATTGNNKLLSTSTNYNIRYDRTASGDRLTKDGAIRIGDVNGDGLGDLVLGAYLADTNGADSGAAWVMFSTLIDNIGSSAGNIQDLSNSSYYNIRYDSSAASDYLTSNGAIRIGDVNGDGLSDLVLGTYNAVSTSGSAYVMFSTLIDDVGATTGNNNPLSTASNYNIMYTGSAVGDYLTGLRALDIGDVNGDGLSDLVLGAYGADNNGIDSGSAYVVYSTLIDDAGITTGNNKSLSGSSNFSIRFDGGHAYDMLSNTGVYVGGDFNDDSQTDLVISSDVASNGEFYAGGVYIIYGSGFSYSLSGNITSGGSPLSGVIVNGGALGSVVTDTLGDYSFGSLDRLTTYTLTPSKTEYTFTPISSSGTLTSNSVHNFVGVLNTYTISGSITDGSDPIQGVTVNGASLGTTTTASDGTYSFANVDYGTNYTISVSKTGYSFATSSITSTLTGNSTHNFTGTLNTYTISGTVTDGANPLQNATVNGGALGTIITDANGTYSFASIAHGTNYTITMIKTGYSFANNPVSGVLTSNSTHNFIGSLNTYTISGRILNNAIPEAGVIINGGSLGSVFSDVNGNFVFSNVPYGTQYLLQPTKSNTMFVPQTITGIITSNITADFAATSTNPDDDDNEQPSDSTTLSGTLSSNNGLSIKEAIITLQETSSSTSQDSLITTSEPNYKTTSDLNGLYTFTDIAPNTYRILAHKNGVIVASDIITISESQNTTKDLEVLPYVLLSSPVYALWNGYLTMHNILEMRNKGSSTLVADVALYAYDAHTGAFTKHETKQLRIPQNQQRDIYLNYVAGFAENTYGFVEIATNHNLFDGAINYYRGAQGDYEHFDYAFSLPFANTITGQSYALFNTKYKTSTQTVDVYNWLSIVNPNGTAFKANVVYYDSYGAALKATSIKIQPKSRLDIDGGHNVLMYSSNELSSFGLIEIVPQNSNMPYIAGLNRYSSNSSMAFGLMTTSGHSSEQYVPITNTTAKLGVLEISNTLNASINVITKIYNAGGSKTSEQTYSVGRKQSLAISTSSLLAISSSGTFALFSDTPHAMIVQMVSYQYTNDLSELTSIEAIPALEPTAINLVGSYNLYLNMYNWLRIFNTSSQRSTLTLSIGDTNQTLTLKPHARHDVAINELGLLSNSYGQLTITPQVSSAISAQVLRAKDGEFTTVTPVR